MKGMMVFMMILTIIVLIIETTIMCKLFNSFLTIRKTKIFSILSFIGLFFICTLPILSGDIDNIIYAFFICLFVGIMFFKDVIIKRICGVFMLYTISLSTKMLAARIWYLLQIKNFDFHLLVQSLIRSSIILLIYLILHKIAAWSKDVLSSRTWIFISIISLSTFVAIVISIFPFIFKTDVHYNIIVITIMTLYILGTIATFYVIKEIAQGERSKSFNSQLLIKMQHYTDMEENQKITRKLLHDMKNHLGVINSFLYDNDIVGAQSYLDNVSEVINSLRPHTFCENKIVNSILNNKYKCFINLDIKTDISVYLPNYVSISQTDLCSIFSNTIDNSVESCKKIQDKNKRYINIKSKVNKGYFVYTIENSRTNPLDVHGSKFMTDKKDSFMHGYGIDIIRNIVNKYNGNMDIECGNNRFSIVIIIKISS